MTLYPRAFLRAQLDTLRKDLNRIDAALNEPQAGKMQIDEGLRRRVRIRFSNRIQKEREDLKSVRDMIDKVDMGEDLTACWEALQNMKAACAPLFQECLAILQGALARSAGLDDGLCLIADALIRELGRQAERDWQRFTILAEAEMFSEIAEIIRLRFPAVSIWDLVIAAHEFGHFMSSQLQMKDLLGRSRDAFQDFLVAHGGDWQSGQWYFLHEFFADLFATYALGPAYAYSTILLRFDPLKAHEEKDGRHPSFAKRVHFMLGTLDRMSENNLALSYSGIVGELRKFWEDSLRSVQQKKSLGDETVDQLDSWIDTLYGFLEEAFPSVRFSCWAEAQQLSAKLLSRSDPAQVLDKQSTLAEVLNAAWLCRLHSPDEERQISTRAIELCSALI